MKVGLRILIGKLIRVGVGWKQKAAACSVAQVCEVQSV